MCGFSIINILYTRTAFLGFGVSLIHTVTGHPFVHFAPTWINFSPLIEPLNIQMIPKVHMSPLEAHVLNAFFVPHWFTLMKIKLHPSNLDSVFRSKVLIIRPQSLHTCLTRSPGAQGCHVQYCLKPPHVPTLFPYFCI